MTTVKLQGVFYATQIHGRTGQEVRDVFLGEGEEVTIRGFFGPFEPDPYFSDRLFAIATTSNGEIYRISDLTRCQICKEVAPAPGPAYAVPGQLNHYGYRYRFVLCPAHRERYKKS